MKKKTILGHTVVRNEENFIWFAVMSVLPYLDKLLIYDLGSTDKTAEIIKTITDPKIEFSQKPPNSDMIVHAQMRQTMLDETRADWVFLLDGDEIWPEVSIKKIIEAIQQSRDEECIVVPTLMLLGDIYHYQEQRGGDYRIAGKKGHFNLRAFNTKIPGLHVEVRRNRQGLWREGFYDQDRQLIYERDPKRVVLLDTPYLHASHLNRSSKDNEVIERTIRFKYELGESLPADFKYPACFFARRPSIVPDPTRKMTTSFLVRSLVETPLKKLKRRLRP